MTPDPGGTTDRSAAARVPHLGAVLVLFLAVSAATSPLLLAAQSSTGWPTDAIVLTQLATAVGALVAWVVWRGRLPRPAVVVRGWRRPLLVAVAVAAVVGVLLLVIERLGGQGWSTLDPDVLGAPLGVVVLLQLVVAAGEEVGWRGVVQPAIETRTGPVRAGVLTGLLFGVGHLHVAAAGPALFAVFVVAAVGLSLVLAHATTGRGAWQRVVVASVLHWLVNLVLLVGFSGGDGSLGWTSALAGATGAAGLACVVLGRRGRNPFVPAGRRPEVAADPADVDPSQAPVAPR